MTDTKNPTELQNLDEAQYMERIYTMIGARLTRLSWGLALIIFLSVAFGVLNSAYFENKLDRYVIKQHIQEKGFHHLGGGTYLTGHVFKWPYEPTKVQQPNYLEVAVFDQFNRPNIVSFGKKKAPAKKPAENK